MPVLSRLSPLAAAALAASVALSLSACGSSRPSPVATTLTPAPSPSAATTSGEPLLTLSSEPSPTPTPTPPSPTPTLTTASPSASPSASPPPSASPSASPVVVPAAKLATLAGAAPQTSSATYALKSTELGDAEVRIDVLPAGYRVSVTRKGATAMLIVRREGDSISCARGKCFVVATRGRAVPHSFDPEVQHAITDYLDFFATAPDELLVADSAVQAPGSCFDVTASGTGPTEVVPAVYCLDADGVSAIDYPTGSLRRLSVNPAPTAEILKPPVAPAPVPTATTPQEPTD